MSSQNQRNFQSGVKDLKDLELHLDLNYSQKRTKLIYNLGDVNCNTMGGCPVLCHMDNIFVFGVSQTEHGQRLFAVLQKQQKGGVTLNQKCELSKRSVTYLGQILDESGVPAYPENVQAITHMR